jgi:TrpR-related protein YerC/YecD
METMKRRTARIPPPAPPSTPDRLDALLAALLSLRDAASLRAFLTDLCTPAELEALADRWAVVPELAAGRPYRDIHDRTGVSVTTVGRVARCLAFGAGGYRVAAERLGHLAPGAGLPAHDTH